MEEQPKINRKRYREILSVFRNYHILGNFIKQKNPAQFREGLEKLGPTFIKIGQLLSVRADQLTPEFAEELGKLQGNTPSQPWEVIHPVLEANLTKPIEDVFLSIEKTSFASASIAQVHHAVLLTGEHVIVKIQHAHIREIIEEDFSLLNRLIPLAKRTPISKSFDFEELVREFHQSILLELDFHNEATNTMTFYDNNADLLEIFSPKIFTEWTTQELLIEEEMPGKELSVYLKETQEQFDHNETMEIERRKRIADILINNYFKQIFEDAFFQADPHPGNILIDTQPNSSVFEKKRKDNRYQLKTSATTVKNILFPKNPTEQISWIDFGMMGTINESMKTTLKELIIAVFTQDMDKIGNTLLELCKIGKGFDEEEFKSSVGVLFQKYYTMSMKNIQIAEFMEDSVTICRKFGLKLPEDIALLSRGIATMQGVVESLNPDISLMEAIQPHVAQFVLEDFSLNDFMNQYVQSGWEIAQSLPKVPKNSFALLEHLSTGKFKIVEEQVQSSKQQKFEEKLLWRKIFAFLSGMLFLTGAILEISDSGSSFITGTICILLAFKIFLILIFDFFKHRK